MDTNTGNSGDSPDVDFGFRNVDAREKPGLVRDLFDRVSDRYDLMNDLMSGGIHRLWKRQMIQWLNPAPGTTLLDVAGGTGDISRRFLDHIGGPENGRAIICDLSEGMVVAGRDKAWDRGALQGIDWMVGDAEKLPLADSSVDAYTIAFGIRNVTHKEEALAEAARVLKPGGRFMCLEFSPTPVPGLDKLYDLYSFAVIPALGEAVANDRDAYRYLVESIRKFPEPAEFGDMLSAAGLGGVRWRRLTGGIAALHSGWRT